MAPSPVWQSGLQWEINTGTLVLNITSYHPSIQNNVIWIKGLSLTEKNNTNEGLFMKYIINIFECCENINKAITMML